MKGKLLILAGIVLAATSLGAGAEEADLSIRYFDKSIYTTGDDIFIRMTVRNESADTYRFRLADNRMFNVEFDVRTLSNTRVSASDQFNRELASNQRVFYREVGLAPGEEYAFTENLTDYVDLSEAGMYVVRARFFPELRSGTEASNEDPPDALSSGRLMLSVRPPSDEERADAERADISREELRREAVDELSRESMPPDEVVEYTIKARQQGQWNRFLLYLDTESLLRSSPERERRFQRLSEAERMEEIEAFEEELTQETVEDTINVVPDEYEIVETSYTEDEGSVVALLRFRYDDFTEIKEYTYFLRRDGDYWQIYDYNVTNVGTE
ncbi:MAG: hypothetical protein ACOCWU_02265 [Spirochaetota bacterium]